MGLTLPRGIQALQTQRAPSPSLSFCHPLPARESSGKTGLTPSAAPSQETSTYPQGSFHQLGYPWGEGGMWLQPGNPAKPKAEEQKSQEEAWTHLPSGAEGRVKSSLGGALARTAKATPPHHMAGSQPQLLALARTATPAWPGKLTHPCEEQLQPLERHRLRKAKSNGSSRLSPRPSPHCSAAEQPRPQNQTGREQREKRLGTGEGGPVAESQPSLLASPAQGRSGNRLHFGHFSQLGP